MRQPLFEKIPPRPPPPLINVDGSLKLHQDHVVGKLVIHNIDAGEGEGVLMELSSGFLRKNYNKFCFIELSQNICDWL